MKAVRSVEGGVAVVDLDEPPGTGELLAMKATSICGSDLSYIRFGSRDDPGARAGRHPGGRNARGRGGDLRVHGVRPVPRAARTTCARRTDSVRSASAPTAGWPSSSGCRRPGWSPSRPGSSWPTPPSSSRPPCRGTPSAWPGRGPGDGVAVVGAGALGLLAVAGARRRGCDSVALEARHPHQKEAGERLGARHRRRRGCTTSSSRRPERRRAWPVAARSWHPAGPSSCWACTSGRCSSTGCRSSTARPV